MRQLDGLRPYLERLQGLHPAWLAVASALAVVGLAAFAYAPLFGTPAAFAMIFSSAAFALSSTGGAVTRTRSSSPLRASACHPTISSWAALGVSRTRIRAFRGFSSLNPSSLRDSIA